MHSCAIYHVAHVFQGARSVVRRTVDAQLRVTNNLLDLAVCLEVSERLSCKRSVDLQAVDEGGDGDQAVGLDILLELVVGLLVEDDGVVGLVLNYAAVSGESCQKGAERAWSVVNVLSVAFEAAGDNPEDWTSAVSVWCGITYPCPLTTSSSASCLRLLQVPVVVVRRRPHYAVADSIECDIPFCRMCGCAEGCSCRRLVVRKPMCEWIRDR
jgi:hypothetical protein